MITVRLIRSLRLAGLRNRDIEKITGIPNQHVSSIVGGRTWKQPEAMVRA